MTVAIIIVAVVVIAAVVIAAMAKGRQAQAARALRPRIRSMAGEQKEPLKAEAELTSRERRVKGLDIRPLSARPGPSTPPAGRPSRSSSGTGRRKRSAPGAGSGERRHAGAGLPGRGSRPDHGRPVRRARRHAGAVPLGACVISESAAAGQASTEDLRQAMVHYRALFSDLLGEPAGQADEGTRGPGPVAAAPTDPTGGRAEEPMRADPNDTMPDEPVTDKAAPDEPARWGRKA